MKSKLKKALCISLVITASAVGFLPRVDGDVSVSEGEGKYDVSEWYTDSLNQKYRVVTENNELVSINPLDGNAILKEAVIPEGITKLCGDCLGVYAETIFIPASVTDMDLSVEYLNHAESFVVDENNPKYCSVDGVVYTKDKKQVLIYPKRKDGIIQFDETAQKVNEFWDLYPPNAEYIMISQNMKDVPDICHFRGVYIDAADDGRDSIEMILNHYTQKIDDGIGIEFGETNPQIIYFPTDCQYKGLFDEKNFCLVVDGENYNERHAKFAYRMACGVEEEQPDLSVYKETGEEAVLFDENKNGTVDMEDVRAILDKAQGRTVTDEEWEKFCEENASDGDVVDRLISIEAVGLKDGYRDGEQVKFTARIINNSSRNLKIESPTSSFGKAGTISVQLDGTVLKNNNSDTNANDNMYEGYLGVNEYIQLDYLCDMSDSVITNGDCHYISITFTYKDENNESRAVSKSFEIQSGVTDGTEYEVTEISGSAAFLSDNAGKIKEYTNELSGYAVELPIQLYEYPGAKYYTSAINENYGYSMLKSGEFVPSKVYTDENGKVWGYVSNTNLPNGTAWYCISSLSKQSNNLKGDVNLDTKVNLLDAKLVLRAAIGATSLSGQAQINADMNEDGKVNLKDAKAVLKKALGITQ